MSVRPAPMPRRIRVLVVDDSAVIRRLVTDVLTSEPSIEVVGVAQNGAVAIERVAELKPDAVTMDIEMPVMDGITAVRTLRRQSVRIPIIMFSTLTERGAAATLDALQAGASDYVTKPSNTSSFAQSREMVREQLVPRLKALCPMRSATRAPVPTARPASAARPAAVETASRPTRSAPFGVLVIGCSTGGPDALAAVLPRLPGSLPVPVLVVQHMPPLFTKMLAQRLDSTSQLTVREAVDSEPLEPGVALIAPGGRHLEVQVRGQGLWTRLTDDPPENYCRPAVDVLFRSVAAAYRDRALGVVLTGMGRDGAAGARDIRAAGGAVIAQDEASSVVWGMPGAVATSGQADEVLPLTQVATHLTSALTRRPIPAGAP